MIDITNIVVGDLLRFTESDITSSSWVGMIAIVTNIDLQYISLRGYYRIDKMHYNLKLRNTFENRERLEKL